MALEYLISTAQLATQITFPSVCNVNLEKVNVSWGVSSAVKSI